MKATAAVFLDRDGVINEYTGPVNKPEDLILFPWTAPAIRRLNDEDYLVFIVTNQGGIELGYFSEQELQAVHTTLVELLQEKEAKITEILYCPHFITECPCRKPKPGMILNLAEKYGIDLANSWMIGDRNADILAGQNAGCRTIKLGRKDTIFADYYCTNLAEAVDLLLKAKVDLGLPQGSILPSK